MKLGFGQIETALQEIHAVDESKHQSFRARLRYLHNQVDIGVPRGGRGRRANFTVGHAFLFALGLELEQFGMTPERIAAAITSLSVANEEEAFHYGVYEAADRLGSDRPAILLYFVPESLSDTTKAAEHKYDLSATTFSWCEAGQLPSAFFEVAGLSRLAVINLTVLLHQLNDALPDVDQDDFVEDLKTWAYEEDHG